MDDILLESLSKAYYPDVFIFKGVPSERLKPVGIVINNFNKDVGIIKIIIVIIEIEYVYSLEKNIYTLTYSNDSNETTRLHS